MNEKKWGIKQIVIQINNQRVPRREVWVQRKEGRVHRWNVVEVRNFAQV